MCGHPYSKGIWNNLPWIDPFLQAWWGLWLSLGRVVPAPHTRHLLELFAAIAQNSLLRSLSIVDRKQHYCRGSEELAIRKSALRATPNYPPSYSDWGGRPRTPSYSELLRLILSCSEPLPEPLRALLQLSAKRLLRSEPVSQSRIERKPPSYFGLPRTPSYSESIRATPNAPSTSCFEHFQKLYTILLVTA